MRWTGGLGLAAGALGLTSCVYGYQSVSLAGGYSAESRPDRTYYCYDCHGYRFFDPYYDYCSYYGFRYSWDDHPATSALYRQRYVRIRQAHPEYGRYRYQEDYRGADRYREPASYDQWRQSGDRDREGRHEARGRREGKQRKGRDEGEKDSKKGRDNERERGGGRPSNWRQGA